MGGCWQLTGTKGRGIRGGGESISHGGLSKPNGLAYDCGREISKILQIQDIELKLRTEDGGGWVRPVRWIGSHED